MKKIIICVTFREFNNNFNDQIQRLFIKSLKEQTYQDYLLIVTTFGERNVGGVLSQEKIPYKLFEGNTLEFRYSPTQVVLNAISEIEEKNKYIIVWTTCDVIFDKDFLHNVATKTKSNYCGTSYPHVSYKNIVDYNNKKNLSYLWHGMDTIFFDADLLASDKIIKILKKYPNSGWGCFEFFLNGIGYLFSDNMINIWPCRISKIDNDRKVSNETSDYLSLAFSKNQQSYESFRKDFLLNLDVYDMMLKYKLPKSNFLQSLWLFINVKWIKVTRFTNNMKRLLMIYTPKKIKGAFKSFKGS